jgi:hypothetical protein
MAVVTHCRLLTLNECVGWQVIGQIDGSGRVKLVDKNAPAGTPPAVDLDLEKVRWGGGGVGNQSRAPRCLLFSFASL